MQKFDIMLFVITDIFKNGSYILFNDKAKTIIKDSFGEDIEEGAFLDNVVSRKKQILPAIMSIIK